MSLVMEVGFAERLELLATLATIYCEKYSFWLVSTGCRSDFPPPSPILYLLPSEIQAQGERGKIGFGDKLNPSTANLEAALEATCLTHSDGLYAVFINEQEL